MNVIKNIYYYLVTVLFLFPFVTFAQISPIFLEINGSTETVVLPPGTDTFTLDFSAGTTTPSTYQWWLVDEFCGADTGNNVDNGSGTGPNYPYEYNLAAGWPSNDRPHIFRALLFVDTPTSGTCYEDLILDLNFQGTDIAIFYSDIVLSGGSSTTVSVDISGIQSSIASSSERMVMLGGVFIWSFVFLMGLLILSSFKAYARIR